ncbi:hypothetical protein BD780_000389 [Clostridium tetanomorphum]|uniref:Uncharacterized protein n=1 Tax=Clostridium tetanomorphum TaxID=1553 RepID=A0A923E8R9_CLOTT|nr:hypothetical protein [Clostridium tetanomorphum]KAJ53015.1 hypothetical protein CTM_05158 [Clostridium tetanomorphum DSM 665]MBC2398548.1 hypothetical protein [Clostridium tetanomorphum]MBP1864958.1 hypothetical protein [Clostridium tetanomorphum]NRS83164.1 hypothetical protein [Clostridium tetanomorphum]NRZ98735.1 hypothetical protein [Clostridium tetanomorphum]
MKKRILSNITRGIFVLFIIWTVATVFIAYNNINNSFAGKVVSGYIMFIFFFIFYISFITILNIIKLNGWEIRKRLNRFFLTFIILLAVNILLTYLIKGQVNILNQISTPLGFSFGIAFWDILFKNKDSINN